MKKDIPNMGMGTSSVFSGKGVTEASKLDYSESAPFFAGKIRKKLKPDRQYTLLDIGTFKGELLAEILKLLPEYKFATIGVDINTEALKANDIVNSKVLCDAKKLPFEDKSIDLVIVRYVLQFNTAEAQKSILKEIARVIRKFAIVECNGPDNINTELWRMHYDKLHNEPRLHKIKRSSYFFASENEIRDWLDELKIKYEILRSRIIKGLSNIYIERYLLDDKETAIAQGILADTDYINQTDWLILPTENG